jgi:CyaY protein
MDESRYLKLAGEAFEKIEDALEEIDPADVDLTSAGDVLTLTLKDGVRCIVNTQRPTRQIWLAARASAWHFSFDEATQRWMDDKGRGDELFATVKKIVHDATGVTLEM